MQLSYLLINLLVLAAPCMGHFVKGFVWFRANGIADEAGCADAYANKENNRLKIYRGKNIRYRNHIVEGMTMGEKVNFCHAMVEKDVTATWELIEFEAAEGKVISKSIESIGELITDYFILVNTLTIFLGFVIQRCVTKLQQHMCLTTLQSM